MFTLQANFCLKEKQCWVPLPTEQRYNMRWIYSKIRSFGFSNIYRIAEKIISYIGMHQIQVLMNCSEPQNTRTLWWDSQTMHFPPTIYRAYSMRRFPVFKIECSGKTLASYVYAINYYALYCNKYVGNIFSKSCCKYSYALQTVCFWSSWPTTWVTGRCG